MRRGTLHEAFHPVRYEKQAGVTGVARRFSSLALKKVKGAVFEKNAELSIVLTGDGEVRALNKAYRKKNKTTDVLSFPLLEGKKMRTGLNVKVPIGGCGHQRAPNPPAGDPNRASLLTRELALLLTHGILHLLGYDHVTRAQEKKMFGLQNRLLKKWKI